MVTSKHLAVQEDHDMIMLATRNNGITDNEKNDSNTIYSYNTTLLPSVNTIYNYNTTLLPGVNTIYNYNFIAKCQYNCTRNVLCQYNF